MKKILILSNGHGEDLVAADLIMKLPRELEVDVFPLVGKGETFKDLPVKVIGTRKVFPSGGFSMRNIFALPSDILSGYFQNLYEQWTILKNCRGKYDLAVGIGDLVPLYAASIIGCPFIFIGVNKTDHYSSFGSSYTPWEKLILKKAMMVFTRDKLTANSLSKSGINARYEGNPLMDCIGVPSAETIDEKQLVVGFLPGTREKDIPLNIQDFQLIARELKILDQHFEFIIATKAETPPEFVKLPFANILSESDVIIGLSGTGNEQAAGMGKPVVAFTGRGSQYTKRFAKAQHELLGEALNLTERNPKIIAEAVYSIINDHMRYEYMSHAGRERMGEPGADDKIALYIKGILK